MRVANNLYYQQFVSRTNNQEANLTRLQDQISSGKRIRTAADDPAGAARSVSIKQALNRFTQFESNAGFATQRLSLEETALDSVNDVLQRVREITIAAANTGSQTPSTFAAFRAEVAQGLDQIIDLANTRDANGDFLFAGFKATTQPFVRDGNNQVQYRGDQGQQSLQISASNQVVVGDSGDDVFNRIREGNGQFSVSLAQTNTGTGVIDGGTVVSQTSFVQQDFSITFTGPDTFDIVNTTTSTTILAAQSYTPGSAIAFNGLETSITGQPAAGDRFDVNASRNQDIFAIVEQLLTALNNVPNNPTETALSAQNFSNTLNNLDQAIDNILITQTNIGARLRTVDSVVAANESVSLQLQTTLSSIEDLDYAQAITEFEFQLFTLEAARSSFSRVEGLSLFDYLR